MLCYGKIEGWLNMTQPIVLRGKVNIAGLDKMGFLEDLAMEQATKLVQWLPEDERLEAFEAAFKGALEANKKIWSYRDLPHNGNPPNNHPYMPYKGVESLLYAA